MRLRAAQRGCRQPQGQLGEHGSETPACTSGVVLLGQPHSWVSAILSSSYPRGCVQRRGAIDSRRKCWVAQLQDGCLQQRVISDVMAHLAAVAVLLVGAALPLGAFRVLSVPATATAATAQP